MSRSAVLLDFSEEIICSIAEYAGALAQYELYKTGTRLLFAKLFFSKYYRWYSNMTYYRTPIYWSPSLVKKLHSLKKFELFSTQSSPSLPDWSFFLGLPSTMEELSLEIPLWPCDFNDRSSYFNLQPHYPNLTSLTLALGCVSEELRSIRRSAHNRTPRREPDHFSNLPKSLTSLSTNIPVQFLPESIPNVIRLRLGNTSLPKNIVAWMAELPLLRELDLPALTVWSIPTVEELEYGKFEPHMHLRTLKLDNLKPFRDNGGLRTLIQYFPHLEYLSVPKLLIDTRAYWLAPNLKFLKSGFSQMNSYSYPGYSWNSDKLEELILVPADDGKRYESMKALLSRLPPFLVILSIPDGIMTEAEIQLLPRSLTKLELSSTPASIYVLFRVLPPNLTMLSLLHTKYYRELTSTNQYLVHVPKLVETIRCYYSILVRTNISENSILNTGWTSTIHAAATGDLEVLSLLMPKESSFTPSYVTNIPKMSDSKIPAKTWRWLLGHGYLSIPSETNRIDDRWLFSDEEEEDRWWAKQQIQDSLLSEQ